MATAPTKAQAKAKPRPYTIFIEVEDGKFGYRDQDGRLARSKHAHHEDQVGWKSRKGRDFTITFAEWPFEGNPEVLDGGGGHVPRRQVHPGAQEDYEYKYTVSMSGLSDDPDIIIDPCNENG